MQNRRFGRSGHMSSVAIFGGAAFWEIPQNKADEIMDLVLSHGVNHIDIAPSYGEAEVRVGPWLHDKRDKFFVGCKTMEREYTGVQKELHASLQNLKTDHFDLYQCHAVTSFEELDKVTHKGGALEAMLEAKKDGLTHFIGITSHGMQAPQVLIEALKRYDFDSVLFPLNFILFADEQYRQSAQELIELCNRKDVGMMTIKAIARGSWGDHKHTNTTWYQPFTSREEIQLAVDFVLSHDVTGICMAGDTSLTPKLVDACQGFTPMPEEKREELISHAQDYATREPLFV
jgi:aryl-alcohol dehydrogenase-like predicted oxidoreductase